MSRGIEAALWGNAVKDGEIRQSKAGNTFAILTLAVDTDQVGDDGKPVSNFIKVLAFGAQASVAANIKKGGRCYCEGVLSVSVWQPNEGPPRPDISLKAFRLEPTRIGQSRPRAEGQKLGEGFNAPLDRMKQPAQQQREFEDEIPF